MRISLLGKLMAVLIAVPLLDLATIIVMSRYTGLLITLVTVVACGVLGALLVRREGIRTWNALRYDLAAGRIPETPLLDGVLVLVSGVLLMTPGPLTDLMGLILLIPAVRSMVRIAARQRVERMLLGGAPSLIQRVTIHNP